MLEWGLGGLHALKGRTQVLVVVDVLSFTTCVDVAVSRGACIYPFAHRDHALAEAEASRLGAVAARPRHLAGNGFSLSPRSLHQATPGQRIILPSPNGSRLSAAAGSTTLFAGCLRNARATAVAAHRMAGDDMIAVIAAGERWPDDTLRPSIEDLLGAGAILDHLADLRGQMAGSAEARLAMTCWRAMSMTAADTIRQSHSGRELQAIGYPDDVEMAVAVDVSKTAALLCDGTFFACHS
ncbi:MAG: 2-phosphosulfolactate phosphatase [Geminicoccaceae bacterium]